MIFFNTNVCFNMYVLDRTVCIMYNIHSVCILNYAISLFFISTISCITNCDTYDCVHLRIIPSINQNMFDGDLRNYYGSYLCNHLSYITRKNPKP